MGTPELRLFYKNTKLTKECKFLKVNAFLIDGDYLSLHHIIVIEHKRSIARARVIGQLSKYKIC